MCAPVKATSLQKLGKGDISGVIAQALDNAVSINAPTFFATNTNLFQDSIAALQFFFTGVSVAPCAIPITPVGIGIFPQVWGSALPARVHGACALKSPLFLWSGALPMLCHGCLYYCLGSCVSIAC